MKTPKFTKPLKLQGCVTRSALITAPKAAPLHGPTLTDVGSPAERATAAAHGAACQVSQAFTIIKQLHFIFTVLGVEWKAS